MVTRLLVRYHDIIVVSAKTSQLGAADYKSDINIKRDTAMCRTFVALTLRPNLLDKMSTLGVPLRKLITHVAWVKFEGDTFYISVSTDLFRGSFGHENTLYEIRAQNIKIFFRWNIKTSYRLDFFTCIESKFSNEAYLDRLNDMIVYDFSRFDSSHSRSMSDKK